MYISTCKILHSLNKLWLDSVLALYRLVKARTKMRTFLQGSFLLFLQPQQHCKNKGAVAAERGSPQMENLHRYSEIPILFIAFLHFFICMMRY